jgi:hypothetical protein
MPHSKWSEIFGFTSGERRGSRAGRGTAKLVGIVLFAVGIASLPWGNPAIGIVVALIGVATFCVAMIGTKRP